VILARLRALGVLILLGVAGALLVAGVFAFLDANPRRQQTIVVGSKAFSESVILAEMFAQQIEQRRPGLHVERRYYLGSTHVCVEALRSGAIDIYPEYTGTALVAILGEQPVSNPTDALQRVRAGFLSRYGFTCLDPLGFNNTYALGVPQPLAERRGLHRISDLTAHPDLQAGFAHEFLARVDGWPGLRARYGLNFHHDPKAIEAGLMYQAAAAGKLDVVSAYSTDSRVVTSNLRLLEDDRHFFPPYEPIPVVRTDVMRRHPGLVAVWQELAGRISEVQMQAMNLEVDEKHRPVGQVVREFLQKPR